jgi:hypothetical protein
VDARVTSATPPVGSAAEEAARLFAAAEQWLRDRTGGPADPGGAAHASGPGGAECAVCPLCQGIAAVRSVRPETVEHLLDAAASFVAALRSTVATAGPDGAGGRRPDVQRIPVSDSDRQGDSGEGD